MPTPYSEEEITKGLIALVLYGGRFKPASRFLKANGTTIPESTLRNWKDRYPDRYHKLQSEKMKEIEEKQIGDLLELFESAQEAMRLGIELETKRLRASGVTDAAKQPVKDAAASVDKMSKAIKTVGEHALALQGRPTQVVEYQDGSEILKKLERLGLVVDAEAVEIVPAQIEASKGESSATISQATTDV